MEAIFFCIENEMPSKVESCTISMIFPAQFSIHECLDSLLAGRALEIFDGT